MAVLAGLVPVATGNRTVPSSTAHETPDFVATRQRWVLPVPQDARARTRTGTMGAASKRPHRRSDAAVIPPPLRTQVRDAVRRAWDQAIDDGAFAKPADDDSRPDVEVEHPADPEHGDLASNLALKLARPYRKPPLEIATLLAAKLVREGSADGSSSPVEAVEVAPPGFLNIRIKPEALETIVDGILASPDALGAGRSGRTPRGQRGVRVSQPDGTAHGRQRQGGLHRRPAEPRARGRRTARHARVLLQRRRRPDPEPRRIDRGDPTRRGYPGRWLPRRVRRGARDERAGRRVGGGDVRRG